MFLCCVRQANVLPKNSHFKTPRKNTHALFFIKLTLNKKTQFYITDNLIIKVITYAIIKLSL